MAISARKNSADKKLSIVVLTYNRKRLLRDCLHSLLAQNYPPENLEIVVSDDGSSDGTGDVVRQLMYKYPHLKHAYQNHKGIPAARNNGIKNATGQIIAIVADDYILDSNYATTVMTFFQQYPHSRIVRFKVVASRSDLGSRISHFYFDMSVARRLREGSETAPLSWKRLFKKLPPLEEKITTQHGLEAAGAAAFRREVFSQAGLFDESLQRTEDTDMTKRLASLGILVYYFPHHHVRHQYSPFLIDTLYKCFSTGFNWYKYCRKHELESAPKRGVIRKMVRMELTFLFSVLWRTRQARSMAAFFFGSSRKSVGNFLCYAWLKAAPVLALLGLTRAGNLACFADASLD